MSTEPIATNPLSEADRKLAVIVAAAQTAFVQLILEGVIPRGEEGHFQLHFSEYANRLFRDGSFELAGHEMKLDETLARDYVATANRMLTDGERIAAETRAASKAQAMQAQDNDEEQKEEPNADLSPNRTLN